jgi:hypothetical protein
VQEVIRDGVNVPVDFDVAGGRPLTVVFGRTGPVRGFARAARRTVIDRYDLHTVRLRRMVDFVERHGLRAGISAPHTR